MISKRVFLKGMTDLQLAFRTELTEQQFSFFFDRLTSLFDDSTFTLTVEKIIETERFFPSIAVFIQHKTDGGESYIAYLKSLGYEK